jgi:hypothetical protein
MIINGDLKLRDSSIKSLGLITEIYGNLDLLQCENLEDLGNLKYVEGYLDLSGCSNLKKLPKGLYVGSFFKLQDTEIEILPYGLVSDGVLYANDKIIKIEKKVKLTDVWLNDCKDLKELPKDLKVSQVMRLDIKNYINKEYISKNNNKLKNKINWLDW